MASVTASKDYANPLLTGIRVVSNQGALGVQATNAIMMYEAMLAPRDALSEFKGAVANYDLIAGVGLTRAEFIAITADDRSMKIVGGDAVIKMPLLLGAWPNLSSVRTRAYLQPFTVPTATLAAAAKAASTYGAQPFIVFIPEDDGIGIETVDTEEGTFRDAVPGRIQERYIVGLKEIQTAARMASTNVIITPSADSHILRVEPDEERTEGKAEQMYILTRK
jgi:hypothetical protein